MISPESETLIRSVPSSPYQPPPKKTRSTAAAAPTPPSAGEGTVVTGMSGAAEGEAAGLSERAAAEAVVAAADAADAAKDEDEEPSCTICLCEFEVGEMMSVLPCLHSFHKECCDQWLREKSVCPMCNVDLVKLIKQQEAQTRELMGGLDFDD